MIQESYVSFEIAKLLKEKGFDEACWSWYHNGNNTHTGTSRYCNGELGKYDFSKATLAHVMRWLREDKGLFVEICCDDLNYNWQILDIWHRDANEDPLIKSASYGGYNEYEKAVESAIKYCLENLI